ncbi:hypothetical protein ONA70_33480 [Micromonospora yasonensis]|uniref:hypothetical protein n=1 Tax=Micromonospora yasonensis TaxID=1128667 RepID=UPI00222ED187|nr:hypothetical protein [Micromonospora yasonensis]MCW3844992.1 hypothetical protein [Micromonospora yasonensis]
MSAKLADEIMGAEYDWLGCDGDGNVALFSTAGGGYAPDEFLRDPDAHAGAIEAILALQATTTARFAPELATQYINIWRLVAERGLFAFDADINGGPYGLVAAPEVATPADKLPPAAIPVLRSLTFQQLRFADLATVSEQVLREGR